MDSKGKSQVKEEMSWIGKAIGAEQEEEERQVSLSSW